MKRISEDIQAYMLFIKEQKLTKKNIWSPKIIIHHYHKSKKNIGPGDWTDKVPISELRLMPQDMVINWMPLDSFIKVHMVKVSYSLWECHDYVC